MNTSVIKNCIAVLLLHFTLVAPLFAASTVNYDIAWTFVYDGGKDSVSGDAYQDYLFDVKPLPDGSVLCAGYTATPKKSSLLIKLDRTGKVVFKKNYSTTSAKEQFNGQSARSVVIADNGDIIVGGERYLSPWVMRLDSSGAIKWTAWYYDSTQGVTGRILTGSGIINSIHETSRGRIICAVGEEFPGGGSPLDNYAAYLEYDSSGVNQRVREWDNQVGVNIAGFSIDETSDHYFLLAGKENVFFLDSTGAAKVKRNYSFMLDGVGSVTNNVTRAKELRDGTLMVAGQAYEGNCWTYWEKLYYDAWWSPINKGSATNITWDTAGMQGADDYLYDFTQLADGRLVFAGKNAMGDGVWTFVTDSTGKDILWEKQTKIIYGNSNDRNPRPFSVCATPDSGFTLVGQYSCRKEDGEMNAFAAHFIYAPKTAAAASPGVSDLQKIRCDLTGTAATFTIPRFTATNAVKLSIFNASGKLVSGHSAAQGSSSSTTFVWDCSRSARGVYFYRIVSGEVQFNGKFLIK